MDTMHRLKQHDESSVPMTPEEFVAGLRMGKQKVGRIKMGIKEIPVRVLSCDEINAIRHEGMAYQARIHGDETDKNLFIQKSTLMNASSVTHTSAPVLSEPILKHLTLDEISYLYEEYIQFMDGVNPGLEQISPERFRELVELLKKNISSWRDCTMPERRAIFTAFVELIQRPDTQTSPQDR